MSKAIYLLLLIILLTLSSCNRSPYLEQLDSPIVFKGDDKTAYRDPAILVYQNTLYMFFTLVRTENDSIFSYTAMSSSSNLKDWTPVNILTPRDQNLNFCSPGNVIRYGDEWVLCLQTYPRPDYTSG